MITTEQLREAIDAFRHNEIHNMYSDFNHEICELYEEKANDFLNDFEPEDYTSLANIANAFCENVADDMEYEEQWNSINHEWVYMDLQYWTNDRFWNYYSENKQECDDNLHEVDFASCDSVDTIVHEIVKVAYGNQASDELYYAMDTIRHSAKQLENYLR